MNTATLPRHGHKGYRYEGDGTLAYERYTNKLWSPTGHLHFGY
ncbi:MAG TPA: hypothetical protein PLV08_15445 [Flavobacteriales bacterium]|jgi:hypothetical protein|nr:hypothetical protein [Flavobacteriales bacterium]HQY01170.1 hypothetical protein [Flavobacteriales bacterium]